MYGLPDDFDCNYYVGKEVLQICIGSYYVQIHLKNNICFGLWDCFIHSKNGVDLSREASLPVRACTLVSLLKSKVVQVIRNSSKELILMFDNQEELVITDNDDYYESFSITYPGFNLAV